MTDFGPTTHRAALDVPPGNAVVFEGEDGAARLGLKALRKGKNFFLDYVVPLDPLPKEIRLVFVDPDTKLGDCGQGLDFDLGPAAPQVSGDRPRARIGDIVGTPRGTFLVVREYTKLHEIWTFVEIATGEVRRLREGTIAEIHREWKLGGLGELEKGPAARQGTGPPQGGSRHSSKG